MIIRTHTAITAQARCDCAGIVSGEQDLRRHSAAGNKEKDVSLQTQRVVVVAYRDERKLSCQHLISRFVDEGEMRR